MLCIPVDKNLTDFKQNIKDDKRLRNLPYNEKLKMFITILGSKKDTSEAGQFALYLKRQVSKQMEKDIREMNLRENWNELKEFFDETPEAIGRSNYIIYYDIEHDKLLSIGRLKF